jgi:hypothetical protein
MNCTESSYVEWHAGEEGGELKEEGEEARSLLR